MAQLEKIGAMIEQRQSLKKKNLQGINEEEEDRDNDERSKDGPRESQKKRTPLSASCQSFVFVLDLNFICSC